MDISALKRTPERAAAIETGEWISDIPQMGDVRLKVRGIGSKLYQTTVARLSRAVTRDGRNRDNSLKNDVAAKITGEALAEHILLDWDGFTEEGEPLAYSKELALQWLTDPDFETFQGAVFWAASVVQNGREETTEALAKN